MTIKGYFIKKVQSSLIFTALFFFVTGTLSAQTNIQELSFGSPLSGILQFEDEIWYGIRPAQTGFVRIQTTGDTDTYLEIYDANNNLLIEDDDSGEKTNARVDVYLRSGAVYRIKLRGYKSQNVGPYTISANYRPMPAFTELRIGTAHPARLTAGEDHWFRVRTDRQSILVVETTGNTDTYLDAYDSSYSYLKSDDDSGEDKNARIEIVASSNQTYYFKLRAYSSNASGFYRITASYDSLPPTQDPSYTPVAPPVVSPSIPVVTELELPVFEPILPGEDKNNVIRSSSVAVELGENVPVIFRGGINESRWYSFVVTEETGFIFQTRGVMNTFLYLYDEQGNLLALDGYSGEDNNALIWALLETGTYYIEIMEYFNRPGRCTLRIETGENPFPEIDDIEIYDIENDDFKHDIDDKNDIEEIEEVKKEETEIEDTLSGDVE